MSDRKNVPADKFVEEYMVSHRNGETYQQLANRLGVKKATVMLRRSNLVKSGVPMPALARPSGNRLDIAKLQAIVSQANEAADQGDGEGDTESQTEEQAEETTEAAS